MYSNSKRVPTYAFGGGLPHRGTVSDCLALSGDIFAPELNSAEEVAWIVNNAQKMGCYTAGPRNLAPILNRVNNYADLLATQKPGDYEVLLVLLDGPVEDWTEACEELVKSSQLPVSVIFVALG